MLQRSHLLISEVVSTLNTKYAHMVFHDTYVVPGDELAPEMLAVRSAGQRLTTCASTQVAEVHLLHRHLWQLV